MIGYALLALGPRPASGFTLAEQVPRLVTGPKIEVGPAKLFDGLGLIEAGGAIDLVGSGSELDFDLRTGDTPTDHVFLCIGSAGTPVETRLTWSAATGELSGSLECP